MAERDPEAGWIAAGHAVARQCTGERVSPNQIGSILAHLQEHQNPQATLRLLQELIASPFANRTQRTRKQLEALLTNLRPHLVSARDWREPAQILGWAQRLMKWHSSGLAAEDLSRDPGATP